jgi:tRNA1Val (adenine37-N6)-methyltransferase
MCPMFPPLHLHGLSGGVPIDVQLLVDFVTVRDGDRVLDLGTGTGAIAIALAARAAICVVGIDTDSDSLAVAAKNLARNRAALKGDVSFQYLNVIEAMSSLKPRDFNIVVSNPPYYKSGSGRVSPVLRRERARRELDATFADFARAAAWALVQKGRFCLVHIPSRLVEILATLRAHNLEPKRLLPVYPAKKPAAELIILEAIKAAKPGATLLAPQII